MFEHWTLTIKNLCFPIFCRSCADRLLNEENGYFCPTCWELSPLIQRPFCTICGQPHAGRSGFGSVNNFACEKCRELHDRPYRRIYGAAHYDGAVAEAIKLLKFSRKLGLTEPLGEIMSEFAAREMPCETYTDIVPVPLHRVRHRDRGFNQSELLARAIVPVFPGAQVNLSLQRIRPTKTQSRLPNERARRDNVRGAFAVSQEHDLSGQAVLLIDDVVTSGGTVSECAQALRRAGADPVDVLALALRVKTTSRTPEPLTIGTISKDRNQPVMLVRTRPL